MTKTKTANLTQEQRDEITDRLWEKLGPTLGTLAADELSVLFELGKPRSGLDNFIATKPNKEAILKAILVLTNLLGKPVVAETKTGPLEDKP